jgi:chitosanase
MSAIQQKGLIQRIVNVFETGVPEGGYDRLAICDDGPKGARQISFGRSQTAEQGNLARLIEMYVEAGGIFAADFVPYLGRIGVEPLVGDERFKALLVHAARTDLLMKTTQDAFFDALYWTPSVEWFERNGFSRALTLLAAYDSYIHSGQVPLFLRKRFIEPVPAKGGDEREWTASYVEVRHQWLRYHERPALRKTIYRTQTMLDAIKADNWDLEKLPILANGVPVR